MKKNLSVIFVMIILNANFLAFGQSEKVTATNDNAAAYKMPNSLVTEYVADANTVLLDHFNGSTSASIVGMSQTGVTCTQVPSATPVSSYVSGLDGFSQALTLGTPVGQPSGSLTYLKYPGGQLLSQTNGTLEFWVYITSYGKGMGLVDQGLYYNACGGWTFNMTMDSTGILSSAPWAAFSVNSGAYKVPLNSWTHLAVTWGSAGAKLYINGVLVGSDTNTGMPASGYGGSVIVRLGSDVGTNMIDELRISNIQRTSFNLFQVQSLKLTSPNGGENWKVGDVDTIKWSSSNVTNVKLEYSSDSAKTWNTIVASTPASTGSYAWTIPNAPSTICKVRISEASYNVTYDTSAKFFAIYELTSGTSCPSLPTITYAGKVYHTVQIGAQCWLRENLNVGTKLAGANEQTNNSVIEKYCYNDDTVNCELYGGLYQWAEAVQYKNGATNTTSPSSAFSGNVQGICPAGWHLPTQTEIQACSTFVNGNNTAIKAIGQGSGDGAGTNTSGYSALLAGYWHNNGYFNSLNSYGLYWNSTDFNTSNAFSMTLLNTDSNLSYNLYYSKLGGFSVRCLMDVSVNLLTPDGGENWQGGTQQSITWSSAGVSNVKLEYTTDAGTNWKVIVASTPASTGSYSWTVPVAPSPRCRVRISDVSNTSLRDSSSAVFTLNYTIPMGNWTTIAPISVARMCLGAAAIRDTFYAVGGWVGCTPYNNTEMYNPSTNTWTQRKTMQTARGYIAVGVLNDSIYAVGGATNCGVYSTLVETYDPVSNLWKYKQAFPVTYPNLGVATINGILYAVGLSQNGSSVGTLFAYNSATDTWTRKADMKTPRSMLCAATVNGLLYAIGGNDANGNSLNTVEAYDPSTDTWSTKTSLTTIRGHYPVAAVLNNVIYVFGGDNSTDSYLATGEAYNAATDQWTTVSSMPTKRGQCAAATANNIIYVVGGYNASGYLSTAEAFSPLGSVISLTSPNGGENWKVGDVDTIKWTSAGIANVKLEYTADNGTTWNTISASALSTTGYYLWTIPNAPSTKCKVRISDASNSAVLDTSNGMFAIYEMTNGSSCSGTPTVTYAGKVYHTVKVGTQCWLRENMDVGTMITSLTEQYDNSILEKYCVNNDTVNCSLYGGLYEWAEAVQYKNGATNTVAASPTLTGNIQGICPSGWHIPSYAELQTLGTTVSSDANALKAIGQGSGSGAGTNTSGFSALLAGGRGYTTGTTGNIGVGTEFYCTTESAASAVYALGLGNTNGTISFYTSENKKYGESVRCLMDNYVSVPDVPVLQSPSTGSTGISITPTLTWTASSGAITYRLQVATDTAFTKLIYDDSTLTATSKQVTGFTNNAKLYWRVNAKNTNGTSSYSTIWSFTTIVAAPQAPVLSSPANSATGQAVSLTLKWNSASTAATYRVQVATDAAFTALTVNDSTVTDTIKSISGLSNSKLYYWRVSAKNAGGTSSYSTIWSFTTILAAPQAPVLSSPANSATGQAVSLTLKWNSASTATTYRVQVATDAAFTALAVNDSTVTDTIKSISGLTNSKLYYWRVSAKNAGGTSSYSSIWTFTTIASTAAVSLSTKTLSFGSAYVYNSVVKTVSIGNTGTSSLIVSAITLSDASYSVDASSFTVTSGGAKTVTVTFSASSAGSKPATMIFTHNAVTGKDTVQLSGTGVAISYPSSVQQNHEFVWDNTDKSSYYRMISVPGKYTKLIGNVLTGTRKKDWNAYWDNGATSSYLIEYDSSSAFNFAPGKGFWLLSGYSFTVGDVVSPVAVRYDYTTGIHLHSGWNIIGNPFEKSVLWSKIISANGISASSVIYYWDGSGSWVTSTELVPYKGYYYYNLSGLDTLRIPYNPDGSLSKVSVQAPALRLGAQHLSLALTDSKSKYSEISVGFDENASDDIDSLDNIAPPSAFEDASLRIYHSFNDISWHEFFTECRNNVGNGQVFDITARNATHNNLTLSVSELEGIPDGTNIYLLDKRLNKVTDLRKTNSIVISGMHKESNYSLLVGSDSFIGDQKQLLVSKDYKLFQNYPNPFNPVTMITYQIPKPEFVTIVVYDGLGREMQTLVHEQKDAGMYEIEFNAGRLSSGVYIYKITAGKFSESKKLLLMK